MSGFDFLFSFYVLLLGLAVANVATGFADMWRERSKLGVGWCAPLLGLYVLLSATQQWTSFWGGRGDGELTMGPWQLLTAMAMALPYIFVSRAMYPPGGGAWPSHEAWYIAHRRVLLGVLLIPVGVSLAFNLLMGGAMSGADVAHLAVRLILLVGLMLTPRPLLHRFGLALLAADKLAAIFV